MRRLEKLCHPLLRTMCEFWSFANANYDVNIDDFRKKIQDIIVEIHEQCESDIQLKREFSRVEKPLIFFVDYTIKEGGFPFSRAWRELARDYNELSGDEKFFDLLAEALDDPEESERLLFFHILMGLGFNGCHIDDNEYIERRMKLCATRFKIPKTDAYKNLAFEPLPVDAIVQPKKNHMLRIFFVVSLILTFGALVYNVYLFKQEASIFQNTISSLISQISDIRVNKTAKVEKSNARVDEVKK